MITGEVTTAREAAIALAVRRPQGQEQQVQAVIDTGFQGWLALPPALIAVLGLAWRGRGVGTLADGSQCLFDVHEATVVWDGQPRLVPAAALDGDPLVGMALLYGYRLTVEVVDGGRVVIEALPGP